MSIGFTRIPLSSPDVTDKEIRRVVEVLGSTQLSLGPKLTEFEARFAEYIGVEHAVAVNSGTSGLHLALESLKIDEQDAVITTPFSFVASANCILFRKATPIFVDVDPATFNIDSDEIEAYLEERCIINGLGKVIDLHSGKRVRAILPVHIFGLPCDMRRIMQIARKYNLLVIEDACEAIGADFHGRKLGAFGQASVFGFYPNKQITTGEGGIILTDDAEVARVCRSLRNQGRDENGGWLAHNRLGYNYRLSDINCVLGLAQLERIDEILARRARVAQYYLDHLDGMLFVPSALPGTARSWFAFVGCLPQDFGKNQRDRILEELGRRGIGCNNYFPPIHLQPFYVDMFGYHNGDFPITESISSRTIALPFHNRLTEEQVVEVVENLRTLIQREEGRVTRTFRMFAVENDFASSQEVRD